MTPGQWFATGIMFAVIAALCYLGRYRQLPAERQPKPEPVETPKRLCARCGEQIKRNHHWSRVAWLEDQRPRHWDCMNPTSVNPPTEEGALLNQAGLNEHQTRITYEPATERCEIVEHTR